MAIGRFGPTGLSYPGGRPAAGEDITVVLPNTIVPALLYTDPTGEVQADNPVTTDGLGNLTFCAEEGAYDLLIRGARIRVYTYPAPTPAGSAIEQVMLLAEGTLDSFLEQTEEGYPLPLGLHPDGPQTVPSFLTASEGGFRIKQGLYSTQSRIVGSVSAEEDGEVSIWATLRALAGDDSDTISSASSEATHTGPVPSELGEADFSTLGGEAVLDARIFASAWSPLVAGAGVAAYGVPENVPMAEFYFDGNPPAGEYTLDWGDGSDPVVFEVSYDEFGDKQYNVDPHEYPGEGTYAVVLSGPQPMTFPDLVVEEKSITGRVLIGVGSSNVLEDYNEALDPGGNWIGPQNWYGIQAQMLVPGADAPRTGSVTIQGPYDDSDPQARTLGIVWGDGQVDDPQVIPFTADHSYGDGIFVHLQITQAWSSSLYDGGGLTIQYDTYRNFNTESTVPASGGQALNGSAQIRFAVSIADLSPDEPTIPED